MINYEQLLNNEQSVTIELCKWVKVNKEDWIGDGLYYDEDKLWCNFVLTHDADGECLVNMTCGGKHFWRNLRDETTKEQAEAQFLKDYEDYWQKIPEYVTPEWFKERGFDWM